MKKIAYALKWILAILIAFTIINALCFFYERQPGWLDTPNGASLAIREPYSFVVHGTEGYAITRVDRNGYLNPDKELASEYILVMGASHSQGKEIASDKKYSVLVDKSFADQSLLHVYNISCDGSFLPYQIKHFRAAMEAFPNASLITIEIGSTDYKVSDLRKSLNQAEYDPSNSAVYFEKMSLKNKIRMSIKDYLPILSKIKKDIETRRQAKSGTSSKQIDPDEYRIVINEALQLIRSESSVPIVFIYHPEICINSDGTISLEYSNTWDIFKEACYDNNIDLIDTGDAFLEYYERYNLLPYGFFNTFLGDGHLNATGHQIFANEIIKYLEATN